MIIEDSFTVSAGSAAVADLFLDIDRVKDCVPGIKEVSKTGEDSYEAVLQIPLGSIRPTFRGTIEIDRSEAPGSLRARAKGRDRSTGSVADVRFEAQLNQSRPDVTEVAITTDITIRGKLGQFGTGVIRNTAQEVLRQFASCANAMLDVGASGQPSPSQPTIGGTLIRALVAYLRSVVGGLVNKVRGRRRSSEVGQR